ncbi:peptidoglycan DD-metalloendopeptidase family protein [Paeniglutamicibacter sp. NPDC091659]|uniref:peptidoglycan DD-metalloendopeptidase family protein n=1 Tax=Paeniglutamicibacter sp. NPDC091659 TaxID=3364389 RepID=UPI003809A688
MEAGASSKNAVAPAVYVQPVNVSLLSDVDAISWDSLEFTSTALDSGLASGPNAGAEIGQSAGNPVFGAGGQSTLMLAGQRLGVRGILPGQLQLIHPVTSRNITSPYGWRHNPTGAGTQVHIGQDYAIACGSPVYAAADGTVVQSAWAGHSGMRVTLDHGNSVRTGYSHNSRLIAKVGDQIKQGQIIALSGTTGNSTGCHVHFEVIVNGQWNDPRNFLPGIPGQPNPLFDSHDTRITAEPIRNTGAPHYGIENGHDLEIDLPPEPVVHAPSKKPHEASPDAGSKPKPPAKDHDKKPTKKPTKKPDTKPSPVPSPKPSVKPTPPPVEPPVSTKPSTTPKPTPSPTPTKPPTTPPASSTQTPTKPPVSTTQTPKETTAPAPPTTSAPPEKEVAPQRPSSPPAEKPAEVVPEPEAKPVVPAGAASEEIAALSNEEIATLLKEREKLSAARIAALLEEQVRRAAKLD